MCMQHKFELWWLLALLAHSNLLLSISWYVLNNFNDSMKFVFMHGLLDFPGRLSQGKRRWPFVVKVNQLSLWLYIDFKDINQPQDDHCLFPCDNLPAKCSNIPKHMSQHSSSPPSIFPKVFNNCLPWSIHGSTTWCTTSGNVICHYLETRCYTVQMCKHNRVQISVAQPPENGENTCSPPSSVVVFIPFAAFLTLPALPNCCTSYSTEGETLILTTTSTLNWFTSSPNALVATVTLITPALQPFRTSSLSSQKVPFYKSCQLSHHALLSASYSTGEVLQDQHTLCTSHLTPMVVWFLPNNYVILFESPV